MKSVARNIGLSWISQFLYIGVQLARVPILYRLFDDSGRGTWFLMASVLSFTAFLEMGFASAFARFYARSHGVGEGDSASFLAEKKIPHFPFKVLAANAKVLYFVLSILVTVVGAVGGLFYLKTVDTFALFTSGISYAWLLLAISQGVALFGYQYSAVLQGRGYVGLDGMIKTIGFVIGLIFLIPALLFRGSLVYVAGIELIRSLVTSLVLRHYCMKTVDGYAGVRPQFDPEVFHVLWKSSALPFIAGVGAALLYSTDSIYIASLLNVRQVSDYYNTHQLVAQFFAFCSTITISAFPSLLSVYGSSNIARFRELYFKILKYSVIIYCLFGAYLFFSCKYIVQLWLGQNHFVGYPLLGALLLFYFFEVQNSIFNNAQFSVERYPLLWSFWLSAGIRYVITFSLVRHYGLLGVIAGKIISQLVTTDWYSAYFCLKTVEAWPIQFSRFRKGLEVYWPVVVFLGVGYVTRFSFPSPLVTLLAQTVAYFTVALCAFYLFSDKETRDNLTFRIRRFMAQAPVNLR